MVEGGGEGGTQVGRQEVTKVPKIECKDQLGTPRGESDVQIAHYFFAAHTSDIRKDNQNCIE